MAPPLPSSAYGDGRGGGGGRSSAKTAVAAVSCSAASLFRRMGHGSGVGRLCPLRLRLLRMWGDGVATVGMAVAEVNMVVVLALAAAVTALTAMRMVGAASPAGPQRHPPHVEPPCMQGGLPRRLGHPTAVAAVPAVAASVLATVVAVAVAGHRDGPSGRGRPERRRRHRPRCACCEGMALRGSRLPMVFSPTAARRHACASCFLFISSPRPSPLLPAGPKALLPYGSDMIVRGA